MLSVRPAAVLLSIIALPSAASTPSAAHTPGSSARVETAGGYGRRTFSDPLNPPALGSPSTSMRRSFELGHAVFNTVWVAAGTPGAAQHDGLGPLFDAASCDECHNEGAHGRGPSGSGLAPTALVIELAAPGASGYGDPRYGHVLTTSALAGVRPEARVTINYRAVSGHYPDGTPWQLRVPRYDISDLAYGALAPDTIIKPRIAPAIFGDGLLAAVVGAPRRRFGWQDTERSIAARTALAFAREMGITSRRIPHDDCTSVEQGCRSMPNGGHPEVSDRLFDALVDFERRLPVPSESGVPADGPAMRALFKHIGCESCHTSPMRAVWRQPGAPPESVSIDLYSDLQLHYLGASLDDRDSAGHAIHSRFRTAPLWGIGDRLRRDPSATFLHDGRARSVEEAILWHHGDAAQSRQAFIDLTNARRQELLRWIETL